MTEENKTGKPDMGVVSWRIGAERKKILTERFGTPSGQAAIEEVMNIYFDLYPALKAEMELLQTENRSLQEIISDLQTEVTSLKTASDTKLEGEIAVAKETIDALKREKEEFANKVDELTNSLNESARNLTSITLENDNLKEELNNLKSDDSIISIRVDNAIVRNLLYALKKHLSERYKRDVSFYEIFVLTTLLYNVEKRCEWFYPYLKDSEIEKITGKTIKEWKAFLKQKG